MDQLKIPLAAIPDITNESLAVVYDAMRAGHLTTFLVGRRRFARPEAIRAWIDFLEAQSVAGQPVTYRARSGERTPVTKASPQMESARTNSVPSISTIGGPR